MAADQLEAHVIVTVTIQPRVVAPGGEVHEIHDPDTGRLMHSYRGAGEAQVAAGDVDYDVATRTFQAVPFTCSCGVELGTEPGQVLATWARHVLALDELFAPNAGGDVEDRLLTLLVQHPVASIAGALDGHTRALCLCGQAFTAPDDDPTNSDLCLRAWAAHVLQEVTPA